MSKTPQPNQFLADRIAGLVDENGNRIETKESNDTPKPSKEEDAELKKQKAIEKARKKAEKQSLKEAKNPAPAPIEVIVDKETLNMNPSLSDSGVVEGDKIIIHESFDTEEEPLKSQEITTLNQSGDEDMMDGDIKLNTLGTQE